MRTPSNRRMCVLGLLVAAGCGGPTDQGTVQPRAQPAPAARPDPAPPARKQPRATRKADACETACQRFKTCAAEMNFGNKFDDVRRCRKECGENMRKHPEEGEDIRMCLQRQGCKPFFHCLMEAAMKKQREKEKKNPARSTP